MSAYRKLDGKVTVQQTPRIPTCAFELGLVLFKCDMNVSSMHRSIDFTDDVSLWDL